jgi:hypothetical protein
MKPQYLNSVAFGLHIIGRRIMFTQKEKWFLCQRQRNQDKSHEDRLKDINKSDVVAVNKAGSGR